MRIIGQLREAAQARLTSRAFAWLRSCPSNTHITPTSDSFSSCRILYQPSTCRWVHGIEAKCSRWVMRVPSLQHVPLSAQEPLEAACIFTYITTVLPPRLRSLSGSFLITLGLLGHGSRGGMAHVSIMQTHQCFSKKGVRPNTPMRLLFQRRGHRRLSIEEKHDRKRNR